MAFMFNVNKIKTEFIDTPKQISDLVDWLVFRHEEKKHYSPTMYIDLEGTDLCREGHISIFTLHFNASTSWRVISKNYTSPSTMIIIIVKLVGLMQWYHVTDHARDSDHITMT